MKRDNISILKETLKIFEKRSYVVHGIHKACKLSYKEMFDCQVFLPEDIDRIHLDFQSKEMNLSCENMDSYSLARKRMKQNHLDTILVLNLANSVHPGGGVRRGARAQEEDLCRKSSLLISLEGDQAYPYYAYNRSLYTEMGSDGVIITPKVEIIRDENNNLLEDSVVVSVMTCAAPCLIYGMEGYSQEEYEAMLYNRILGMLKVAAYTGYEHLVLGAFGCGAFRNDARLVSDLFKKALNEIHCFETVDFAVLDKTVDQYNYKQFDRNFNHSIQDAIRGSLVGGAMGDALGYAIEFKKENTIFNQYGPKGICAYELTDGKALFSDDTQMTLFTANGILKREAMKKQDTPVSVFVEKAYRDWLFTQNGAYKNRESYPNRSSWLLDIKDLYAWRAPGNTCLSALEQKETENKDYIHNHINNSKGCGGIMRIAPLALYYRNEDIKKLDLEGAQIAAITHGHSLGYMPAAVLTHIISRILSHKNSMSLKEMVIEARDTIQELFKEDSHIQELVDIINLAIQLSVNNESDLNNIHRMGEGWVAEETLGIALYCSLKYQNDFSKALIVSVNHNGDSDSTGAVTGNILGAYIGYASIEQKWKENLECLDLLLEMADDLSNGVQNDSKWHSKYVLNKSYQETSYTFFWKENEKYGEFSNWFVREFEMEGITYPYVEKYMMAQKAKVFKDLEMYQAILQATTPKECKALGRKVRNFDPVVWNNVKYEIVKKGNRAKFEQNTDLKQLLLETNDTIIAEASPYDKFWGIGLYASQAQKIDPDQWPGQNLLGKVLMELREEFKIQ